MCELLNSKELWTGVVGGVVTAGLLALIAYLWNFRRNKILSDLIEIMGRAIEHRNLGHQVDEARKIEWVRKAESIKQEAVVKAQKLSPQAGALVNWLDRVPLWDGDNEVDKWISFLSKIIERIRELLERNS